MGGAVDRLKVKKTKREFAILSICNKRTIEINKVNNWGQVVLPAVLSLSIDEANVLASHLLKITRDLSKDPAGS